MSIFDIFKRNKQQQPDPKKVDFDKLSRSLQANILAIVNDNKTVYLNKGSNHLYKADRHGEHKLHGNVAILSLIDPATAKRLETFVGFDEQESYMLFVAKTGMNERFNYIMQNLYNFYAENIPHVLDKNVPEYATQHAYTYRAYKNDESILFINMSEQGIVVSDHTVYRGGMMDMWNIFRNKV